MADPSILGRFLWHELLTTDTKSAAQFFTKVIGWKTRASREDSSYQVFLAGGQPAAGLLALPDEAKAMGAPPSWCTYIGTPDADGTARLAVSLGGRILKPPTDIPDYGRFAVLQDPQGATFAIYAPTRREPDPPRLGGFSWHELVADDWPSALAFYQRLFEWEPTEAIQMGEGLGTYQMFGYGGKPVGGIYNKPPVVPMAYWLPYIRTTDSKETATRAQKQGAQIMAGPMQVPGGDWIFVGSDLQGATFAVHSAKPAVRRSAKKAKRVVKKAARKAAPMKPARKPVRKGAAARTTRGSKKKPTRRITGFRRRKR